MTSDHVSSMRCGKCNAKEMRRRSRSILDQLGSLYPYTCGHCGTQERKFRLTVFATVRMLLICGVLGGGIWFFRNPFSLPSFGVANLANNAAPAQQDQTEALARARTAAGGELSTFEQMMLRKPRIPMNNATVLKLVKANVGKDVILQMIRTSSADYDLSANAVIELKQEGVEQAIILTMIDVSYATR